jgi:hypothetical protein
MIYRIDLSHKQINMFVSQCPEDAEILIHVQDTITEKR